MTDPQRIMAGPPSYAYAGFEGSFSLSQKNLELARSKYLLDKVTGRLPKELRQGKLKTLPPIGGADDTKSQASASHAALQEDKQIKPVAPDVVKGLQDKNDQGRKTEPKVWSDLDKMIELLLDSKNEEETVFMYLQPNKETNDPYDLNVVEYDKRKDKYYTLSGKGLTLYENDVPVEFISLG